MENLPTWAIPPLAISAGVFVFGVCWYLFLRKRAH